MQHTQGQCALPLPHTLLTAVSGYAQERRIALLLYGFPPGVGATGTAALLNVPKSLERLLEELQLQGYDLGPAAHSDINGEAIVNALRMQEDQRSISAGAAGIEQA